MSRLSSILSRAQISKEQFDDLKHRARQGDVASREILADVLEQAGEKSAAKKWRHGPKEPDAKAVRFFYKNATRSLHRAKLLAWAEAEAKRRGYRVDWEYDPDSWDPAGADYVPDEVLGAILIDRTGEVFASLSGIADPDNNYRRVVEAELALEALPAGPSFTKKYQPRRRRYTKRKSY